MTDLEHFINIGLAISSEKKHQVLLEKILKSAKELTNADGGTIYSISADNELVFDTILNDSLGIHLGGTSNCAIEYPAIPIYIYGEVNRKALVAIAAATGETINISDVYNTSEYDLTKAKAMDLQSGYHTQSVLTIPLKDHNNDLIGVLQLINAQDVTDNIIVFSQELQRLIESLASLAAIILTNKKLIDDMEELFGSFSKLIAIAIDRKSPYTGGHCRRVPEITMLLAKACNDASEGALADFSMDDEDLHQLSVAAWLHDCGKIATPESVMDKSTKLETIFDRVELVQARFEIVARDIYSSSKLSANEKVIKMKQLESDRDFVCHANIGGEFFTNESVNRVHDIAKNYHLTIAGKTQSVLSDNEVLNLITQRGTLTNDERRIINGHMDVTVEMLEALPFPKHLKDVPEYACGHHEKMDGTGYPKGLKRDEMSIPARMMAIADIFEALTANDRPYKKAKTISESLNIMVNMKKFDHIDPDLFDVFVKEKVYLAFAQRFLDKEQIDIVEFELYEKVTG